MRLDLLVEVENGKVLLLKEMKSWGKNYLNVLRVDYLQYSCQPNQQSSMYMEKSFFHYIRP